MADWELESDYTLSGRQSFDSKHAALDQAVECYALHIPVTALRSDGELLLQGTALEAAAIEHNNGVKGWSP